MAGEAHVADLDPFDLLDSESERVGRFFSSGPDWDATTRCEGWTVRDMVGHLAGVETYHLACLDDTIGALFEEAAKDGVSDLHSFNDWAVRTRADASRDDVLDEWRAKNQGVRRRLRERGRDGTLSSSVGLYPVGLMAFHIASEYATHADDMAVEIASSERDARTAWRLAVSRFALEENDKPVAIEERGNAWLARSGDSEAMLSAEELVEAVTARLPAGRVDDELRDGLVALA